MITLTSVEAQNRFGQLLDAVQREPVTITRRGRPVATLMAADAFETQKRQAALAAAHGAHAAIGAFRGAGRPGAVEQLLQDRSADVTARDVSHIPVPATLRRKRKA